MSKDNSRVVYSTDSSQSISKQDKLNSKKPRHSNHTGFPDDGVVRLSRLTKGRKGKGVTVITGVSLPEKELKKLAKQLKAKCGAGGTVKDGVIEIQGDHRDLLIVELEKSGWKAKISGG